MTSQASLTKKTKNKKHSSAFTVNYLNNLKSNWFAPIATFLMIFLFYDVLSFMTIKSVLKAHIKETAFSLADNFTYILTSQDFLSSSKMAIPYLLLLAGIYLGFEKFKFMNRKNEVNVFFSLGITRTKMYLSTFLAGLTQIAISVLVPMLISCFINLGYMGSSKQLFLSLLYLTLGFIVITAIGFSISSFIATNVGSNSELIFYSLILMVLPNILLASVDMLFDFFVLGNEYGINGAGLDFVTNVPSLQEKYSFLLPANTIGDNIVNYVTLNHDLKFSTYTAYMGETGEMIKWAAPKFTRILGWFIVGIGINIVSIFSINKRPAEHAGFFGSNKVLNYVMSFILSYSVAVAAMVTTENFTNGKTPVFIALIAFIVVYAIVNIVLVRKLKPFLKSLKLLPIHLVILGCIVLIFSTGFFGYSKKVPEVSEIKSIEMSVPSGRVIGLSESYGANCYGEINLSNTHSKVDNISDKEDLELVTSLHKKLIKDGKQSIDKKAKLDKKDFNVYGNVYIKYKLKDGETLTRFFKVTKSTTLKEFLKVEDTKRFKEMLKTGFKETFKEIEDNQMQNPFCRDPNASKINAVLTNPDANVYILSKHLDMQGLAPLNKDKKAELVDCMYKDLNSKSSYEINMPKEETLGVIKMFVGNNEFINQDEMSEEDIEQMQEAEEVKDSEFSNSNLQSLNNNNEEYSFIVTANMKNTIKFLEDNALLKYFDNSTKVVKAEVVDKRFYYAGQPYMINSNYGMNYMFGGGRAPKTEDGCENSDTFNKNKYETTDKKVITELEKDSYYSYFVPHNCYFVRYTLDNDDTISMCIPQNKIPQNIKTKLSNVKIEIPKNY